MTKTLKITFLLFSIIISTSRISFSQNPTYTLIAKNFQRLAPDSLVFDIYMLHTDANRFEYAAGQYFFTFNTSFANGGTLTYRKIGSGLPDFAQPRNPTVTGNELRLAGNAIFGNGNGPIMSSTSPGTLIVKMSLKTSSGSFAANQPLNLAWKNSSGFYTRVYAYVNNLNTEISTPSIHSIDSTTISINQISSLVPDEYAIFQNYPNPFNPATKIKFNIPELTNLKLTVFDVTGKEVENLVNTKLSPGTYEYTWNAVMYSSGVYFYRIQTDAFIETKRMILLK
ncbi:MAG: T9SS type A sorting domain-containing protein [Bacteroidota bacterium]|nr:T9SS type A sorting domain-containing protein [Bacteroidota bacterium]